MNIGQLLQAVKVPHLSKEQVEEYFDSMNHLFADLSMEMGDLKKEEALFIFEQTHRADQKITNASASNSWRVTEKGRRMIEVDASLRAVSKELSGLKHKIFNSY